MANTDVMARFYNEINAGNHSVIDEVCAEDLVEHEPFAPEPTREGVRQFFAMARAAFPDLQLRVLHMVGDGDLAIAHGLFEGTHEGEFMGMAPTQRRISVPFADIVRFRDGLAVEHWGVTDTGAMMQQLGAAPGPTD
jgi:predicted ester cyclase